MRLYSGVDGVREADPQGSGPIKMQSEEQLAGVRAGDVLAGKYRVDRVLGVGGMGVVVAAHHLHLDERVAIKFLLPASLGNQEAVMRFAREARAAVKIKSEHVARVSDVGTLENGAPYMVMEYLEGQDLAAGLLAHGPMPCEQAVDFVLQACEAIAEAHAIGIVHRDLKPANLFLARLPGGVDSVKVLDFGISKLGGLSGSGGQGSQTKTSAMMGSPLYMSPEQMQSSKDADARSDIWSLGVILYELMAGRSPFVADTLPELVLKIVSSAPAPLSAVRADVPDGLQTTVLRCLNKDRAHRPQTVGELAIALAPFGSRRARNSVERIVQVMSGGDPARSGLSIPASLLPPVPAQSSSGVGAGTAGAFVGSVHEAKKSGKVVGLSIAAALVVGLVGGALGLRAFKQEPRLEIPEGTPSAGPVATPVSASTAPPPATSVPTVKPEPAVVVPAPVVSAPPAAVSAEQPRPAAPATTRTARPAAARTTAKPSAPTPAPAPTTTTKKASPQSLIDERY